MSASDEWTEWHLTPQGWLAANNRVDFVGTKLKPDPDGSVAVFRYSEYLGSMLGRMRREVHLVRSSGSKEEIEVLTKKFGPCPDHL